VNETVLHNNEVNSLVRLNMENHNHLIRLLVTFKYKNHLYLMFPWANGNLHDFWMETYPEPTCPRRDCDFARWMIAQCLGIAEGLQKIHNNPVAESAVKSQDLKPDTIQKRHGRHGDLKPENILWFGSGGDATSATLRISDFGFADFYGSRSKSTIQKNYGFTRTYRAPEWDVLDYVSPQYDIWCMGCILLEFVVWYLYGAKGIQNFIEKRLADSISIAMLPGYQEDSFFNNIIMELEQRKATAKRSVHEVRFLAISLLLRKDSPDSRNFFHCAHMRTVATSFLIF
jgi:serine/threonine protein kinase